MATTPTVSRCTSGSATASAKPRFTRISPCQPNVRAATPDALSHAEQALRLYQAIGDKTNEAEALNNAGWYHGLLGDYQQARAFCRQALTLSAEADHRRLEGYAWDSVGYAEYHLGNLAEAAACYQRALSIFRESGDRFCEADTLTHLADARHAAGEQAQARQAWQQALAILDDLHHPDAEQVRAKLSQGDPKDSREPVARQSAGAERHKKAHQLPAPGSGHS